MMKDQGIVVIASLMIIVLSFMFYLFSNVLNFFIIGIGMGLFIVITAMFFMLSEIRDSIVEMSDAVEMNNIMIDASGRSITLQAREPQAGPDDKKPAEEPLNANSQD
ncbi:MAG TPA: hypothetical protein VMS89_01815 [Methanoregulaceae archaeon]|nr:hypothetical protein [Methanoregulaceae archaeon]